MTRTCERSARPVSSTAFLLVAILMAAPLITPMSAHGTENRNAATWYRRAAERLDRVSQADWEAYWIWLENPHAAPTPQVRSMMAKIQPMLQFVDRGAEQEYADYHLDYSQGFDMLLTHLAPMRSITKLMRGDALVKLHDGDAYGAAERIASMYHVAGHFPDDQTLISSLVGQAVFSLTEKTIEAGFDRAAFSDDEVEVMLRAVERFDEQDPFGMTQAIFLEQDIAVSWLNHRFGTEEGRASPERAEDVFELGDEAKAGLRAMSDEDFAGEIDRYDRAMDVVVEAFISDDEAEGKAALETLMAEVEAGEHGLIAQIMMPSFTKLLEARFKGIRMVRARREMLREMLEEDIEPLAQANAAAFYARAIDRIRRMDPERLEMLCAFECGERTEIDENLAAAFEEIEPTIEIVRAGSEIRRCDFSILGAEGGRWTRFLWDYIAGMRDVFRLLHADAMRAAKAGEVNDAIDRIVIAHRVVTHLSTDPHLLSAAVAHVAFNRSTELTSAWMERELVTGEARGSLYDVARRLPRGDAFGYINAGRAMRAAMTTYDREALEALDAEDPETAKQRADLEERIRTIDGWDDDQLLHFLVFRDERWKKMDREHSSAPELRPDFDPATRLTDIIDIDELNTVRALFPVVEERVQQRDLTLADPDQILRFARIVDRRQDARGDLRDGIELVRPPRSAAAARDDEQHSED